MVTQSQSSQPQSQALSAERAALHTAQQQLVSARSALQAQWQALTLEFGAREQVDVRLCMCPVSCALCLVCGVVWCDVLLLCCLRVRCLKCCEGFFFATHVWLYMCVLCFAVLCCAVLCCAVLCCGCAVPCCVVLCYAVLCCAVQRLNESAELLNQSRGELTQTTTVRCTQLNVLIPAAAQLLLSACLLCDVQSLQNALRALISKRAELDALHQSVTQKQKQIQVSSGSVSCNLLLVCSALHVPLCVW